MPSIMSLAFFLALLMGPVVYASESAHVVSSQPSSTISIFFPVPFGNPTMLASVVSSDVATTTFALCMPVESSIPSKCQPDDVYAYTYAPGKSLRFAATDPQQLDVTATIECSVGGTTTAFCTTNFAGKVNEPGVHTETYASFDINADVTPLVLTTGMVNTAPTVTNEIVATITPGSSAPPTVASSVSCSAVATASGGSSYGNSTNSTVSASATPTNTVYTGGLPQVTGKAELVVGAIAAGVAVLAFAL